MVKKLMKAALRGVAEMSHAAFMFAFGFWSLHWFASLGSVAMIIALMIGGTLWMFNEDVVDTCKRSMSTYEEQHKPNTEVNSVFNNNRKTTTAQFTTIDDIPSVIA